MISYWRKPTAIVILIVLLFLVGAAELSHRHPALASFTTLVDGAGWDKTVQRPGHTYICVACVLGATNLSPEHNLEAFTPFFAAYTFKLPNAIPVESSNQSKICSRAPPVLFV